MMPIILHFILLSHAMRKPALFEKILHFCPESYLRNYVNSFMKAGVLIVGKYIIMPNIFLYIIFEPCCDKTKTLSKLYRPLANYVQSHILEST